MKVDGRAVKDSSYIIVSSCSIAVTTSMMFEGESF
jgi:hypothetical protein